MIEQWIWTDLTREAQLTKELTFEKLEATAEDVIVILRTLWERAADLVNPLQALKVKEEVLMLAAGLYILGWSLKSFEFLVWVRMVLIRLLGKEVSCFVLEWLAGTTEPCLIDHPVG